MGRINEREVCVHVKRELSFLTQQRKGLILSQERMTWIAQEICPPACRIFVNEQVPQGFIFIN